MYDFCQKQSSLQVSNIVVVVSKEFEKLFCSARGTVRCGLLLCPHWQDRPVFRHVLPLILVLLLLAAGEASKLMATILGRTLTETSRRPSSETDPLFGPEAHKNWKRLGAESGNGSRVDVLMLRGKFSVYLLF